MMTIDVWRKVVDFVHKRDTKIAMQIVHLGRLDIPELRGSAPIAPSVVPTRIGGVVPREMTRHDIEDVVEKFAQASRRVRDAGFDAVQYHGAHGNLIHNFMSPFTNLRTDEYGGSTENRSRFVVEIIKRTRELVGPDYPLMIKMSFDDFINGGLTMNEAIECATTIAQAGIDCIEVSGGSLSESMDHIAVKKMDQEGKEAYFRPYAKALKERVAIPVILVGGLRSPGVMKKELEDCVADFLAMSRPFIREPALVKRWENGDLRKAKCVSCNKCFDSFAIRPLRCYVENPLEKT
jgi:2,4-dienoyl-CoA reductase-like NADH-dependent reductase (Old Yellow Enzyme family)